jgi:hypothetical protein
MNRIIGKYGVQLERTRRFVLPLVTSRSILNEVLPSNHHNHAMLAVLDS